MRYLLCVVLIAEVACWTRSEPAPPRPRDTAVVPRTAPACTEGGDRLVLRTCREGDELAWTITNRSDVTLWAFVAPQGTKQPTFSYANVVARADHGTLVLSKLARDPIAGERVLIGSLQLAPGESARGVVPVGTRVDPAAEHITGAEIHGPNVIRSVTLEIGFAEHQPSDQALPTKPEPLVVVINFRRARQEIVRAPAVLWR